MGKWQFKNAVFDKKTGAVKLLYLSAKQRANIAQYEKALEVAARSQVACPRFSKYFVKESLGIVGRKAVPAGNIEYGFWQALHGEESAVAAFRSWYGRKSAGEIVLGIIAGTPGNVPAPCGNCRDIILDDLGPDFEIVSGAAGGGLAIVTKMRDYLFEDFTEFTGWSDIPGFQAEIILAAVEGERLTNDAYSSQSQYPERAYSALLNTDMGFVIGARDTMCDEHTIYALRDAVRQARRKGHTNVRRVVVVASCSNAPHVMYKDRQHLAELILQNELVTMSENDPPIFLVSYQDNQIKRVWRTTAEEWIPHVFSPRNFGPEFMQHLTEYFRTKGRR